MLSFFNQQLPPPPPSLTPPHSVTFQEIKTVLLDHLGIFKSVLFKR